MLCWFKHAPFWKLQRAYFSSKVCKFIVLQIIQNSTSHPKLLIINYIIIRIIFEGFTCWSKHAFMWRLQKTEIFWSKWLKQPYIYGTHWHNITKRALLLSKIPPQKNGTQHKRHLTKTASHKNGIPKLFLLVFSSTTNTLLIKPTPTIRHKLEKLDFKIPWPWVWIILQI